MSVYIKKLGYLLVISALLLTGCPDSDKEVLPVDKPENNVNVEAAPFLITQPTPNSTPEPVKLTLDDVLAIANNRRHVAEPPEEEWLLELVQNRNPLDVSLENLTDNGEKVIEISTEEAIEDANIFFDLLRNYYGAYNYYGGDEVFLPIFNDILTTLKAQEKWYVQAFYYLLYNKLSTVIVDNHFATGLTPYGTIIPFIQAFSTNYNFFVCQMPFDKIEGRFRKRETGEFVKEVKGHNIDEVFRLATDENGEFCYLPIIMKPSDEDVVYNLEIVFDNGKEEILNITKYFYEGIKYENSSLQYEGDIPIVTIRSMETHSHHAGINSEDIEGMESLSENIETFLSSAEELRDAPVIIVDIRSNFGGDAILPKKWLYTLKGETVPNSFVWFFPKEDCDDPEHTTYFPRATIGNYDFSFINRDVIFPNDQLIIVLVDRNTASSSEAFTDQLLNMENTLIIGQNTMGCLLTSLGNEYYLPNSNIMFMMNSTLIAHMDDEWQEGVGIEPDIWVTGDALKAALAMLEKNNF